MEMLTFQHAVAVRYKPIVFVEHTLVLNACSQYFHFHVRFGCCRIKTKSVKSRK